jgi:CheY-like chemotaxis protein
MSVPSTVVLIVEDEMLVRENAADMLESAGYTTLQARDAAEAIAILESRDDIRVVFTDVQMPGSMDGLRLAALIRDRWPPVELIVTSGQAQPNSDELPERARFLPKPYSDASLVGAIAPLLA